MACVCPLPYFARDGQPVIRFKPDLAAEPRPGAGHPVRTQESDFVNYDTAGISILAQRGDTHGVTDLEDLCSEQVAVAMFGGLPAASIGADGGGAGWLPVRQGVRVGGGVRRQKGWPSRVTGATSGPHTDEAKKMQDRHGRWWRGDRAPEGLLKSMARSVIPQGYDHPRIGVRIVRRDTTRTVVGFVDISGARVDPPAPSTLVSLLWLDGLLLDGAADGTETLALAVPWDSVGELEFFRLADATAVAVGQKATCE